MAWSARAFLTPTTVGCCSVKRRMPGRGMDGARGELRNKTAS